ncbi:MAG: hypothetical protein R3195_11055 [Gemmatimonadota bacterium]|nr:hypothetical protein [Gemmatimonadota bacterium]
MTTENTQATDQDATTTNGAPKTTFVSFLLDETGSMESIKDDTIGGFNEYVKTLQGSGGDILFSLVSFNSSRTEKRHVADPIGEVRPLTAADYRPHAMTPLIDASVKLIKATDEAVARRGDDPNVVIVLQTDGQENVSVEYTRKDLALLVKEKETAGWEFVFLGAGLDAFDAAHRAGLVLSDQRVMSYGRARSPQAFAGIAMNVAEYAERGMSADLDFSPDQRAAAGDEYHDRRERKKARKRGRKGRSPRRGSGAPQRGAEDAGASTVDDFDLS